MVISAFKTKRKTKKYTSPQGYESVPALQISLELEWYICEFMHTVCKFVSMCVCTVCAKIVDEIMMS